MRAAFNTDWHLSDDVTLTLGTRYTKDKKQVELLRDNISKGLFGARFPRGRPV